MQGFVEFIKIIGISDSVKGAKEHIDISGLAEIAVANKLQPLLAQNLGIGHLWQNQYGIFLSLLSRIGELFDGLDYAVVKTVRPVPHLPSDIDVLIDPTDFNKAFRRLTKGGFRHLDNCPYGATLHHLKTGFNIDLSKELTVAGLVYISRSLVLSEVAEYKTNGVEIKVPRPHMDLLIIVGHSVFKEWIYTLRDFYTAVLWLRYLKNMLDLAYRESDTAAAQLFLAATYAISREAVGKDHPITRQLADFLQEIPNNDLPRVPYKYRYVDLARAYISKAGYFLNRGKPAGLVEHLATTKAVRLFGNSLLRKSY